MNVAEDARAELIIEIAKRSLPEGAVGKCRRFDHGHAVGVALQVGMWRHGVRIPEGATIDDAPKIAAEIVSVYRSCLLKGLQAQ